MLENGPGVFSGFYFSVVCENWRIWEYSYNVGGCRFFVLASDDFFVWWIAQVIWGPDWLTNSHGFSLVEIICQSTDDGFLRLTDGIWSSAIDVVIELSPSSFIHSTLKLRPNPSTELCGLFSHLPIPHANTYKHHSSAVCFVQSREISPRSFIAW